MVVGVLLLFVGVVVTLLVVLGVILARRPGSPEALARHQDAVRPPESYSHHRPGDWPGGTGG